MINIKFPITKNFTNGHSIIFNKPIQDELKNHVEEIRIDSGFLYSLHGNNGIGKTTFMNILSLLHENVITINKNITRFVINMLSKFLTIEWQK